MSESKQRAAFGELRGWQIKPSRDLETCRSPKIYICPPSGPILGAIRARWAHRGRSGAIAPLPGRYVTRVIPLGAKPNQNSRPGNGLGHRGGTSETTPGGSPQWPVVRTPTLQRTRKRTNAVKRTVLCAAKHKNTVKGMVLVAASDHGTRQSPALATASRTPCRHPNRLQRAKRSLESRLHGRPHVCARVSDVTLPSTC